MWTASAPTTCRMWPRPCRNSFTAGTVVQTDEGEKPIEEVAVGDKVFAEDPETGEQGYFEVVALTNHPTDEVLQITIDAEDESGDNGNEQLNSADTEDNQTDTMEITPDHPVYIEGKGWINAENLVVGDELRRSDGGVAKVLAVERVQLAEPQEVYNFTVKGLHTYFVLDVGVLVHNTTCDPEAFPHLKKNLETGGFSPEESNEIIQRFSEAGVTDEQLKMMDELFENARVVEVKGVKLIVAGNTDELLVWRIADEGHLHSHYSTLPPDRKRVTFGSGAAVGRPKYQGTDEEVFKKYTAEIHATKGHPFKERVGSPHVATAAHLAPVVRTKDTRDVLPNIVLGSDKIHILQIPHKKLEFGYMKNSEMEILANDLHEPLDSHLVIELPNIFRDKAFTERLRGG